MGVSLRAQRNNIVSLAMTLCRQNRDSALLKIQETNMNMTIPQATTRSFWATVCLTIIALLFSLPSYRRSAAAGSGVSSYSVGVFYEKSLRSVSPATIETTASIQATEWKRVTDNGNIFKGNLKTFSLQIGNAQSTTSIGLTKQNDSQNVRYQAIISTQQRGNGNNLKVYVVGVPSIERMKNLALNFKHTQQAQAIDEEDGAFHQMTKEDFTLDAMTITQIELACQENTEPPCVTLHAEPAKTVITINEQDIAQSNFGTVVWRSIPTNQANDRNGIWNVPYDPIQLSEQEKTNTAFELTTIYGTWHVSNLSSKDTLSFQDFFKDIELQCGDGAWDTMVTLFYQTPETENETRILTKVYCTNANSSFSIRIPRIRSDNAEQWKWSVWKENCAAKQMGFDPNADSVSISGCVKDDFVIQTEPQASVEVRQGDYVIRSRDTDTEGKMYLGVDSGLILNEPITITISKPGFLQKNVTLKYDNDQKKYTIEDNTVSFEQDKNMFSVPLSPIASPSFSPMRISGDAAKKTQMKIIVQNLSGKELFNGFAQDISVVPEGSAKYQFSDPSNSTVRYYSHQFESYTTLQIPKYSDEKQFNVTVALEDKNKHTALQEASRAAFKIETSMRPMEWNGTSSKFQFPVWLPYNSKKSSFTSKEIAFCYRGCQSNKVTPSLHSTSETLEINKQSLACYPPQIAVVISGNQSSEQTTGQKYWTRARDAILEKWETYQDKMRIYFSSEGTVTEYKDKAKFQVFGAAPDAINDRAENEIQAAAAAAFKLDTQDACGNALPEAHVVYIAKNPGIRDSAPRSYVLHLISPDDKPEGGQDDWNTCKDKQAIQQTIETIMKGASQ